MTRRDIIALRPARGLLCEIADADDAAVDIHDIDTDAYLIKSLCTRNREEFMAPLAMGLHTTRSNLVAAIDLLDTYQSHFLAAVNHNRISTISSTATAFADRAMELDAGRRVLGHVKAWTDYVRELVMCADRLYVVWSQVWTVYEDLCAAQRDGDFEEMDERMEGVREQLAEVEARQEWAMGCANEVRGWMREVLGGL